MRKFASLSLDLDNQWSYMKTRGDAGWEDHPSYLDAVVPRILSFLAEREVKITFFVIGQDAALEKNRDAISAIAQAGHEIANHSFNHEPWLHLYSKEQITEEFEKTEAALEKITGTRPVGFRGPGFSLSPAVIQVLAERGYEYDCSTLPSFVGPIARYFYFIKSPGMSAEERERLSKLFGEFSDGLHTLKPTRVDGADSLVEIPVTTFPIVKTPIHASYLMYLAGYSAAAAKLYWKAALAACRATGVAPSMLLHPLDFMSGDDAPALKFFPGMDVPASKKLDVLDAVLASLTSSFEVGTTREHARRSRELTAKDRKGLAYESA